MKLRLNSCPLRTTGALFPWRSRVTKIYGKSRSAVFPRLCVAAGAKLCGFYALHVAHIHVASKFLTQCWRSSGNVSGSTTGVPPHCRGVAGRTRHIRRCESSSLPAVRDPNRKSQHQSRALAALFPVATKPQSLSLVPRVRKELLLS